MKKYGFTLDITGTCYVEVSANSLEEATNKVLQGEGEYELNEWDVSFPYQCSPSQVAKFCSVNPDKVK